MPDKERIYWDSMTFNYRIAGFHPDIAILRQFSERAERGEIEILTSAFTLCEVAKVESLSDKLTEEEQEHRINEFFKNPYILIVQVDRKVGAKARDIIRRYSGIKGKDGVHIASAIIGEASIMHTYDQAILRLDRQVDPSLRIETPQWKDSQPPLIDE